ncbi:MAG: anthranilate phosphoribosyltransferase [Acidobacteria bacterium]|nr:MAG: anthranilate phosphoribosyltransferase [Acidobacteriota bacterium]
MEPAQALAKVVAGNDLSSAETEHLFGRLMDGQVADSLKAGLLIALAMKGESAEEIAGAAQAMRRRVVAVSTRRENLVDTCGTGGDGKGSFNISTAAALVTAGAGVAVAKHGNRSVSSRSGSADVLAALGVDLDIDAESAGRSLDEVGIAFLFAPSLHPAMREVVQVRRELGVRTIFNVLGPLANPAGARRQVVGVYSDRLVDLLAQVLSKLGSEHALVVHGADGLDEISTTGPTKIAEVREGQVTSYTLEPEELGLERVEPAKLEGGSPEANAAAMRELLAGAEGPLTDITLLNAGAAIWVGGGADDLATGLARARETWRSGAAARKLEQLVELSRGSG